MAPNLKMFAASRGSVSMSDNPGLHTTMHNLKVGSFPTPAKLAFGFRSKGSKSTYHWVRINGSVSVNHKIPLEEKEVFSFIFHLKESKNLKRCTRDFDEEFLGDSSLSRHMDLHILPQPHEDSRADHKQNDQSDCATDASQRAISPAKAGRRDP